ncbi:MAG: hypothetical protein AVDCRST_MAG35-1463, partial [uncultured Quadrisphaera sp.]
MMGPVTGRLLRWARGQAARLRRDGRPAVSWAVRLTGAAVASYAVALLLLTSSAPLLAPLTALLVVQLTPVSLLVSGLDRIASVVAGVALAVTFAAVFDRLTWWSLGLVIAASIVVGQVLRLGANLIEVPISAMLVMGAYGTEAAAGERIVETLIGAAVGVTTTLLLPPSIPVGGAGRALRHLGEDVADLLERAGDDVGALGRDGPDFAAAATSWLDEARRIDRGVPDVLSALLRAEEARRLNLRSLATPDSGPGLRHGMEALERSAVAVRSMFRSFLDARATSAWYDEDLGPDVRAATSLVLHELSAAVRAFGRLTDAESQAARTARAARAPVPRAERRALHEALEGLREAQARLVELVLVDDPDFTELNAAMLTTVRRLLAELDLDERLQHLDRARGAARRGRRPPPAGPRGK